MKRLLAGTLAAALALGLTGCGQQQEECDAKPVIYLLSLIHISEPTRP